MADKILSLVRRALRRTHQHNVNSYSGRMHTTGGDSAVFIKPNLESSFNVQINAELYAGYAYLAMANYFGRQCVALPGCAKFYWEQVKEEEEHARKLIEYLNRRGGRVFLLPLPQPCPQEWDSPLSAFKQALHMEVDISQKLLKLHEECEASCDRFASNMIENHFLDEQIESVDQISRYIAQLERIGREGLSVHIFDEYLLNQINSEEDK